MSYLFRVQRGRALHIIHETMTRHSLSGVRLLCKSGEASFGDRVKGVPTCTRCLALDDPCGLSDAERSMLARFATQDPPPAGQIWSGQTVTSLHKKDLIDKDEKLTRRGAILALDWTVGAAAAADKLGVVHARDPLSRFGRCSRAATETLDGLGGLDNMTVDRYARLRALAQRVTCVLCAVDKRA